MTELTLDQGKLIERLTRHEAGFEINSQVDAQNVIDFARQTVEDKIKKGDSFKDFLRCDPEDDGDIENNNTRNYSITPEVEGRKVRIGLASVNYNTYDDGTKEAYLSLLEIPIKSLRHDLHIGSLLLQRIEADAIKLGCKSIIVSAINNKVDSQEHPYFFYKNLGYKMQNGSCTEDEIREATADGKIISIEVVKNL